MKATSLNHVSVCARDLEESGIFDREMFGHHAYELPNGCAQPFIRDPAGNCVEIDSPDAPSLDRAVVTELKPFPCPQSEHNQSATLFLGRDK